MNKLTIDLVLKYLFIVASVVSALFLALAGSGIYAPTLSFYAAMDLALLAPFILLHVLKKDTAIAWLGLILYTAAVFLSGGKSTIISFAIAALLFAYFFPWGSLQDWGKSLFKFVGCLLFAAFIGTASHSFVGSPEQFTEIEANRNLLLWGVVAFFSLLAAIKAGHTAHRRIMTDTANLRVFVTATLIALSAFFIHAAIEGFFIRDVWLVYPVLLLALLGGILKLYEREEKNNYSAASKKNYPVRISIVMPCHNGADFIEAAFDSVQSQTEQDWELLIVNDGSQDRSQEIIDAYTAADARIKSFLHQTAQGAGAARNTGLTHAAGRYVAFLDCDDLWKPEKLSVQTAQMERTGAALSTTHYDVIDDNNQTTGAVTPHDRIFTLGRLLKCNDIGCSAAMIDRSLLGDVRFPDYRKAQDFVLWCNILRQGFLCLCIHRNLGAYRLHSKSRTLNKFETSMNRIALLQKAVKVPLIVIPYYVLFYIAYGTIKQLKSGKGFSPSNKTFQKQQ